MSATAFELHTSRLVLREFREADADDLYQLNADSDVMRYTGDAPFPSPAAARKFIRDYDHYARHGFGRWAVIRKADEQFMGFCGLRRHPEFGDVDLAYRIAHRFWDSGYATEAARAALGAGFDQFGLDTITGWAMRENLPSITVLQKLGMRFREMAEDNGVFWLVYAISRERYASGG
ncbi:GNAT family N-acetyltransferase [Marinihelvus fidelis]|uniref:GNAT family N-acetyltransferase n=1 Tax=Marinihelvus fidelis TaxID=2613842 RepID=UPI00178020C9|nr:GNAT family N-acetyltransferase [Marinihelvus fidelis]